MPFRLASWRSRRRTVAADNAMGRAAYFDVYLNRGACVRGAPALAGLLVHLRLRILIAARTCWFTDIPSLVHSLPDSLIISVCPRLRAVCVRTDARGDACADGALNWIGRSFTTLFRGIGVSVLRGADVTAVVVPVTVCGMSLGMCAMLPTDRGFRG